jgi:hypothetical protein
VGTFVVAQQGRSPGKGELWQMRMLHEHDEKVAGGSGQTPPVTLLSMRKPQVSETMKAAAHT